MLNTWRFGIRSSQSEKIA